MLNRKAFYNVQQGRWTTTAEEYIGFHCSKIRTGIKG